MWTDQELEAINQLLGTTNTPEPLPVNDTDNIADLINDAMLRFDINTKLRRAHFLSQVGHESNFEPREENLYYTTASRMQDVYGVNGRRKKLYSNPDYYLRHPERLANYVYSNRMGNGGETSGDGWKYRGRGLIQLTGKNNYAMVSIGHNSRYPEDKQDFIANPKLLLVPRYAVRSACVWWVQNGMNELADNGSIEDVTRKVNGGINGLIDRERRFNQAAT